jgi:hypothetical protein
MAIGTFTAAAAVAISDRSAILLNQCPVTAARSDCPVGTPEGLHRPTCDDNTADLVAGLHSVTESVGFHLPDLSRDRYVLGGSADRSAHRPH